jgi:tetratricopeptide (TPR) repeat protein
LLGYCDDLATPGTLGPFRDLVGSVGADLSRALQAGDSREQVLAALRAELDWQGRPTVLVVEDVHWADDATLDVLRYLVRRIAGLPAVLVLTYRDDELGRDHPLRQLLGHASGAERVHHLPLKRLSAQAVRQLSAGSPLDGEDVYSVTSGNPFAAAGAHREAAAHYELVLEQRERFPPAERADLLERYAIECYTIGIGQPVVDAQEQAVDLRRSLGDPSRLGAGLRWLSRMGWWVGDRQGAEAAAGEAIEVLQTSGDRRLLALALSNQSQLHMLAARSADSIDLGERAAELARTAGDAAVLSHALTNVGICRIRLGDAGGTSTIDEALRVALDAGENEHACRAYVSIIWQLLDEFRLDEAEHRLSAALDLAEESEHFGFLAYLFVERARLEFARSSWEGAVRAAEQAVGSQPPISCPALTVLGRVRVRLGLPGAGELLRRAWDLAVGIDELQRPPTPTARRPSRPPRPRPSPAGRTT